MSGPTMSRRLGRPTLDEAVALRETFLNQAFVMLCERGVHGFSMDALAKASGVTKRTIYRQYKSKNMLIEAVVDREASRLADIENLQHRADALPIESLRLWGWRIFEFLYQAETERLVLLLRVESLTEIWAAEMLAQWKARIIASASTLIESAQRRNELRLCSYELLAILLMDLLNGVFHRGRHVAGEPDPTRRCAAEQHFQQRWKAFLQLSRPDWAAGEGFTEDQLAP